ncbi:MULTISPECIES: peptidoglycan-binding protein [unclassified Mesorhizobium]|uniref:peptidoglycan-binding protein n=1 Tax=unclassified Mesorhizobium TaxID=325217 RepID=UPI000FDA2B0B|nr:MULTISPECIES: peptidoglycan-binding protein [unclassified Mesorhizobium]TGR38374.1 peptidoglycan-binding protein [bacterium M00.F.Ca.ET.199.01.1.1]TGU26661.1 peptidoglycan-binding protein [bacterium M00.F.Ca.ET.156.01.1.1]TGV83381.1 peptidoglycan-binding protein [Mesorhizobium sp. M00.F.Ca.ET.149.01.1.1]TGR20059.1 peptidoglycan-binding protein [Mesorhizobium sp. M8A.F.Ca.ET.202.01.1.1]TGR21350.1 peptidoglycan-binding protein [Mesorhizobium sp. M8A.F.Ca.ET.197.01.1.1]
MNSKRSYLDTLNAGRQRKPQTTLEQLNRSLETLEQRLGQTREDATARPVPRQYGADPRYPATDPRYPAAQPTAQQRWYEDPQPAPRAQNPAPSPAFDQNYQAIARAIDRVRGQEDSVAMVGKIAGELRGMREELRHQVTSGLQREFDALRKDIDRAFQANAKPGATGKGSAELGVEFERLSGAIKSLSEKSDDRSVNLLRLELEQVKAALDTLAREESVQKVDRRWDDFDRRWTAFEDRVDADQRKRSDDPALAALTDRLEQISNAVNNLPESLSLRSLEEKVRTLAGAVDHFASQQDNRGGGTLAMIDERLDEISRAIVASTVAAQANSIDHEAFERIEKRIDSLAQQIEEVAQDRPGNVVIDRLNTLSSRVDDLAGRANLPEQAMERLAKQIALIADKIDQAPAMPDADYIFHGLEQRFDVLSGMMERRQGDAIEQGNMLFRDLERRLDEVADRLDQRSMPQVDSAGIMDAIDARFTALAKRMETRAPDPAGEAAIRGLESRLEDISSRLDASAAQVAGIDPALIRSLEAQVAGLSAHLSRPSTPLPDFEDISPRLNEIEKALAGTRDSILGAAREAAENAVRSLAGTSTNTAAVSGLAQDLKTLETLTRRSDERNSRTFEAIHDTLLKIVDRLGSLETSDPSEAVSELLDAAPTEPGGWRGARRSKMAVNAPSMTMDEPLPLTGDMADLDARAAAILRAEPASSVEPALHVESGFSARPGARSPAEAAAAAAMAALGSDATTRKDQPAGRKSMFGGLARAFKSKKAADVPPLAGPAPDADIPSVDLDEPLDPKVANRPLEPGSGAPDLNAIMKRVRDERGQPAKPGDSDAAKSDFIAAARRAAQAAAAEADALKRQSTMKGPVKALRIGDLLKARRKPILMAAAAIMLALAGLQLGKAFLSDPAQVASNDAAPIVASQPVKTASVDTASQPKTEVQPVATDSAPAPTVRQAEQSAPPSKDDMAAQTVMAMPSDTDAMPAPTAEPAPAPVAPAMAPDAMASASPAPVAPMTAAPTLTDPAPAAVTSGTQASDADAQPASAAPTAAAEATANDTTGTVAPMDKPAATAATKFDIPAEAGPVALRDAAAAGDAKALFEVGSRYAESRGVKEDMPAAAKWYEKSAELGFAPAEYRIGNFYEKGIGVARDIKKSKTWYQLAAAQGNASAMHNLAVLFAMAADGVTDNESAAHWFQEAADLGVKDSQFNLGILAAKGVGMKQNLEESYKWFALVAKTGDKDAAAKRDEIANALRPEQLERARAATELWKAKPLNAAANSVDIPESWQEGTPQTTAGIDMKKAVKNIQLILNKNGYDAGGADGVMGEKTKNAIIAFQTANKLPATGAVDEKLVKALLARK